MWFDYSPLFVILAVAIYSFLLVVNKRRNKTLNFYVVFSFFYLYILALIKIVFLPFPLDGIAVKSLQDMSSGAPIINVIPLKTIVETLIYSRFLSHFAIQILGNILLFVPMGVFVPLLNRKLDSLKKGFVFFLLLSISVELIQLIASISFNAAYRFADIDDIILNVLGGMIGFLVYKFLYKRFNGVIDLLKI
jgi:glycopeptide antibiotics resistance protein